MTIPATWQWPELLIVGAVILITVFVIAYVIMQGGFKGKGFEIDAKGKRRRRKQLPPHVTCPHAGDIIQAVVRTTKIAESKINTKYSVVEAQMRFYEEQVVALKGALLKVFAGFLKERIEGETAQHAEFVAFKAMVDVTAAEVKDYFRLAMRQNHLAELNDHDWHTYKRNKEATILQMVTELFNAVWRGTVVTRSDVYRLGRGDGMLEKYVAAIEVTLEYCHEEAVKARDELHADEVEYERWLGTRITGDTK